MQESTLTTILAPALGGPGASREGVTTLLLCVHPSKRKLALTQQALAFGQLSIAAVTRTKASDSPCVRFTSLPRLHSTPLHLLSTSIHLSPSDFIALPRGLPPRADPSASAAVLRPPVCSPAVSRILVRLRRARRWTTTPSLLS